VIRYDRDADGATTAAADVAVGTRVVPFRIPLGAWLDGEPPPGGLSGIPVVLTGRGAPSGIVERAVSAVSGLRTAASDADGRSLLTADREAGVLLVARANGRAMNVVRALGGRPLPVLPVSRPDAIAALFDGCQVDVEVAIPRLDDGPRATLRATLAPFGLEVRHHVVEVDPRAGLADGEPPTIEELAAAAAGVLAGRLAAGRRRFLDRG
jgi:hypothetical protein